MPPAAHSSVSGDVAAMRSATSGTSVNVARFSPCPPASDPCATITSARAVERVLGVTPRLHLADQLDAGRLDARDEGLRIAEREEDGAGPIGEHLLEQLGARAQRPGDEAVADLRVAGGAPFVLQPCRVAVAAADEAEAAGARHRRGEPAAGGERHRRGDDGVRDAEALRQPGR